MANSNNKSLLEYFSYMTGHMRWDGVYKNVIMLHMVLGIKN